MANKIKVMIVDDQSILAEGIKSILETDEGLEVVGLAVDGFDALEKLASVPVDVVLLDIRMPNMNGVVATQRIKADYPEVKVVILTTFDDSDYILNAI
ncbi:MAG: response regulator transcription factor, partial [Clostridia bacterium]|nr:response regulator transcription factor [Clostridia bacterium]